MGLLPQSARYATVHLDHPQQILPVFHQRSVPLSRALLLTTAVFRVPAVCSRRYSSPFVTKSSSLPSAFIPMSAGSMAVSPKGGLPRDDHPDQPLLHTVW